MIFKSSHISIFIGRYKMADYTIYNVSGATYVIQKTEDDNITDLVILTSPSVDNSPIKINVIENGVTVTKGILKRKDLSTTETFEVVNKFAPDVPSELKRQIGDHLRRNLRVEPQVVEREFGVTLSPEGGGFTHRVRKAEKK
jgi:hypothetical protein